MFPFNSSGCEDGVAGWLLWWDGAHDAAFNMAADDCLLDQSACLSCPVLRVYDWSTPSFTLGRSQRYPSGLPPTGSVVRRPTGGGVVCHEGSCTYALVTPAGHPLSALDSVAGYQFIHTALAACMGGGVRLATEKTTADPLTMRCFDSPTRFDILDADGVKCAGAAQVRRRGATLTQGSVRLAAAGGDRERLRGLIVQAFAQAADVRFTRVDPHGAFLEAVRRRADAQYASVAWNHTGTLPTAVRTEGTIHA